MIYILILITIIDTLWDIGFFFLNLLVKKKREEKEEEAVNFFSSILFQNVL